MGADCCGGKKALPPAEPVRDSCDGSSVTSSASTGCKDTDCCTPNNEKCNKECLLSVAATLCTEDGHTHGHTDGHHDSATGCSDKPKISACDTHLQMAFEQYQSFLDNARCICRNMIERGYKSCCKTTEVEAKTKKPNAAAAGSSNCKASGKGCCAPKPTAGEVVDACSADGGKGQRQLLVVDTKISGPGTCCTGVKGSQSRQQSDDCCGSKKQASDCSNSKKQTDNCCSSKKQTDNCCNSKRQTGGCCGGEKQTDDCSNSKKQTDDCCSSKKQTDNCCSNKTKSGDTCVKQSFDDCCRPGQKKSGDDCCSKNQANGFQGGKRASSYSTDSGSSVGCRDQCCEGKAKRTSNPFYSAEEQCQLVNPQIGNKNEFADVERGSGEAVRIGVTGMTCNGCSDNLARNLSANGACNIRVNYLQGHADFTMDSALNLETILAKTREATGFQITMMSGDESITVLTPDSQASAALTQIDFDGVKDVVVINKRTVRIQYNPTIVGARELFHNIEHLSVILAPPQNDQQLASGRKRFIILLAQTVASFILTIPVLVLAWGETRVEEDTKAIIELVLGTLVQFLAVPVFYKPALKSLILNGALELDMLVVVAITAAFVYSIVAFGYLMAGMPLETAAFFETSTLLISLVMLGRLVASYARIRAVASVSVRSLQASTAILVEDGVDCEIDSRLLQFGDIFKVTPHSRVPTDGTIISGASEVDESMVTGESLPVPKGPGASLIAGTTNGSGTLIVRLTRLPGKNTITDIAKLVEDASSSRPRVQEIADRVAGWFLPTVLTIAIVVFIIWTVVGLKVRNQTGGQSVATAITYAVAVLAVSCPCGLGLAVPLVLVIANGIAARGGVIVKSAECTERSRKITDVVFDKTGTLTEPDLDVITEEFFDNNTANARAITKALISDSEHPVSVAIAKHLGPEIQPSPSVTDVKSIPGAGIEGSMSGLVVRAGNANWTRSDALPEVRKMLDNGMSILVVMQDSTPIAAYGLQARLRPDAATTVMKLREDGINVHLVSGDQNKAVQAIAAAVGIDRANVASQQKPEEKQVYVAGLMAQPGKVVMFCGDGMNDAVAVAQADIGVQLSNTISSEVTRSAADVVLLSGLSGIPFLIEVSRAAFVRTTFNFVWSAIYNVFSILLAAGAFVRIRIAPAYAGAGELVSILPVIIAALTMLLLKLRPN